MDRWEAAYQRYGKLPEQAQRELNPIYAKRRKPASDAEGYLDYCADILNDEIDRWEARNSGGRLHEAMSSAADEYEEAIRAQELMGDA